MLFFCELKFELIKYYYLYLFEGLGELGDFFLLILDFIIKFIKVVLYCYVVLKLFIIKDILDKFIYMG